MKSKLFKLTAAVTDQLVKQYCRIWTITIVKHVAGCLCWGNHLHSVIQQLLTHTIVGGFMSISKKDYKTSSMDRNGGAKSHRRSECERHTTYFITILFLCHFKLSYDRWWSGLHVPHLSIVHMLERKNLGASHGPDSYEPYIVSKALGLIYIESQ